MAEFLSIQTGKPESFFSKVKRALTRIGLFRSINLLILIALVIVLPLTILVASKQQEIRQRAAEPTGIPSQHQQRAVPDEILLKFKPGVSQKARDAVLKQFGINASTAIPHIGVIVAKVPEKAKDKLIRALSRNPFIQFAEPNKISQILAAPNDPWYPKQWHLQATSYMHAPAAWDLSKGKTSLVVGVIDTGIQASNPDLTGKVVAGQSFVSYTRSTEDDKGHGTEVAGVIGAISDNGIGGASLGWNTSVMPLKACDQAGLCGEGNVSNAIIYAADHGVKVINLSFGGPGASSTEQDAINYAWSKGLVITAASGDTATQGVWYPAAADHVIGVGMADDTGATGVANYGPGLDVVAPGSNIFTTILGTDGTSSGFGSFSGTSASTPQVSALAALLFAAKPTMTNQQVVDTITATAKDFGDSGWDQYHGYGGIQADAALQKVLGITIAPDTQPPTIAIAPLPNWNALVGVNIPITVSAADNVGVTKVEVYIDGVLLDSSVSSPYSFVWDSTTVPNGTHTITAKAYDSAGNNSTSDAIVVTVANPVLDTTPPTVTLVTPSPGTTVTATTTITASATDDVAIAAVSFFVDGEYIDQAVSAPYTIAWDTTQDENGNHTLTAIALDSANNSTITIGVGVIVNNSVPSPTPTPSPTLLPTVTLAPTVGFTPIPSPTVLVPTTAIDTTPPNVTLTSPQSGAVLKSGAKVTLAATASDTGGIAKVDFLINGSIKCTDTSAPYTCNWNVPGKKNILYTISARAVDISSNTASSSIVVSVR